MFAMTRILGSGLALVFPLTAAFTAASQEFSLKLHGPNTAATTTSEVHVKSTITNTSSHEIRFAVGFGNHEFDYDVEVADADGRVPPSDSLHQRLQQSRCLHCCSDCYRVERTSSRAGLPPLWTITFSRRTRFSDITGS
jgi:hypothetical protein